MKPESEPSLSTSELTDLFGVSPQRISKIADKLKEQEPDNAFSSFIRGRKRFYKANAVRKFFKYRGFHYKPKVITFTTLKGGTGKTTLSLGTARRLTCFGAKLLFIDLDKQANATITLLDRAGDKVLLDVIQGSNKIDECLIKKDDSFWILPSSLKNSRLEIELASKKINQLTYYKNLLQPIIKKYNFDYVIIDTPPDLSHSVYLAMLASDILIIPVNLDRYAIEGLGMTLNTIKEIRKNYENISTEIKVCVNRYDAREKTALNYLAQLKQFDDIDVMPSIVRVDSNFRKSQKSNALFDFGRRASNAAIDIDALTRELIGLDELKGATIQ